MDARPCGACGCMTAVDDLSDTGLCETCCDERDEAWGDE